MQRFTTCIFARLTVAAALAAAVASVPSLARAQAAFTRLVTASDLFRIRDVSDPQMSPDGEWVAYAVTTRDSARDESDSDIWMTSWDGARTLRLTTSPESEHTPRWSPDGRSLAFLSGRGEADGVDQVWLLPRAGGEATPLTDLAGGVSDYAWSRDGRRLALISRDPEPEPADSAAGERPQPIVVDRFFFKQDGGDFLLHRRDHLYLFDVATKEALLLTPGDHDEAMPVWSPDGSRIAFVTKRGEDPDRHDNWDVYVIDARPGAEARQVTTFEGADAHPDYGSRPTWSPDGRSIAFLQGGTPEEVWYGLQEVAVAPAAGGDARVLAGALDRNAWTPRWSADGKEVFFLLEDDRSTHLASVPARGGSARRRTEGRRFLSAYA
ncbi:MAG: TolB family protein, partial [Gemmatimonadota bacterium]